MTHSRHRNATRALVAVSSLAVLSGIANGATTWTGLGSTNNWSDAGNWSGGIVPSSGDVVVFDGQNRLSTIQDLSGLELMSLQFAAGAGDFDIAGQAIGILGGGSIQTNAAHTAVIGSELRLDGATTIVGHGAGSNQNGLTLANVTGSGSIIVEGTTALGIGADLTIGNASFGGPTIVNGGSLRIGGWSRTAPSFANLLVGSTANQGDYTINSGSLGGFGTIGLHSGGKITLNGSVLSPGIGALAPDFAQLTIHGDLAFGDNSIFEAEALPVSPTTGNSDRVTVDGLLDLSGVNDALLFHASGGPNPLTYVLMDYQMRLGSFDALIGLPANGQLVYTSAAGAGPGQVILVVPEPATSASAAIFATAMLASRRRRRFG